MRNLESKSVRVRFPNESYYDIINNFKWDQFKPQKYTDEYIFGYYYDTYVEIFREDFEKK